MKNLAVFLKKRDGRFLTAWGLQLVVFWAIVLIHLPAAHRMGPFTAAFRNNHASAVEMVWHYEGPRPEEGEVLRVSVRTGTIYPREAVGLVAYLGSEKKPMEGREVFRSSKFQGENYFHWETYDIEPWPRDSELWLGTAHAKGATLWLERGDGEFAGYSAESWIRTRPGGPFRSENTEWIPGFRATVVENGAPLVSARRPLPSLLLYAAVFLIAVPFLGGFRRWWLVAGIVHVVLLFKAFEALFPSQWWWGSYYLDRFGHVWFWAGLIILQILLIPWAMKYWARPFRWLGGSIDRIGAGWTFWIGSLAAALLFLWATSQFWVKSVYGDAYGSLAWPGYDYHNPFATAFYHAFRDLVDWLKPRYDWRLPYGYAELNLVPRFVVCWAPVYVFGAVLLSRELARSWRETVLFFLTFLGLKSIVTFFGYIEVYGPVLAVHAWLAFFVMRGYRKAGLLLPTGFSFFAYLFHLGGALVLPAILGLWLRRFRQSSSKILWLISRVGATALLAILIWLTCLGSLFILKHDQKPESFAEHVPAPSDTEIARFKGILGEDFFSDSTWQRIADFHGLPLLYGSTGRPHEEVFLTMEPPVHYTQVYPASSWEHASQLTGAIVFVGGPIFLLACLGILGARRRHLLSAERWGLLATMLAFFLGAALLSTNYPYPKDWDVASTHSLWWLAGLLWAIGRGGFLPSKPARWLLTAILLYMLWDTLPWLIYNVTWGLPPDERSFVFI